jgi:hypothetical protein
MSKESYNQFLKRTIVDLIDRLESLDDFQKDLIKTRWLDQLLWLENSANKAKKKHYGFRLVTILGGVIVPALVGISNAEQGITEVLSWTAFGLSQAVAMSVAIEELFQFGDRYRTFRKSAESLKTEGQLYFCLAKQYSQYQDHAAGFKSFAATVEGILQEDVSSFLVQIQQDENRAQAAQAQVASGGASALERINQLLEERLKEKDAQVTTTETVTVDTSADSSQVELTSVVTTAVANSPKTDLSILDNAIERSSQKTRSAQA